MTDKDIIKALECDTYTDCRECPHIEEDCYKNSQVSAKDILDLINRQQAEIERLQKGNDELGKAIAGAYELNCFLEATRKIVRVEAIKEFAERLKNIYIKDKRYDRPNAHTLIDWLFNNIDNLVKEMVGDK